MKAKEIMKKINRNYLIEIEFDGIQHFEPIEFFGGQKEFKETQIRDNLKNKYAKDNNIKLLRISYKDLNNISDILNNFSIKLSIHCFYFLCIGHFLSKIGFLEGYNSKLSIFGHVHFGVSQNL